jgi:hypothetical protein
MNEEEKFDELLRSKLSEREFPFDELNWDEAERLIASRERWSKIKRFTFIFSSGLAVGIGAMLPFMLSTYTVSPVAIASKSTINSSSVVPAKAAPLANQSKENISTNNTAKKEEASQPLQSAFVKKNTGKGMGANSPLVASSPKTSRAVVLAMGEKKKKNNPHHNNNAILVASAGAINKTANHKELNSAEQATDVNSSSATNNNITKTDVVADKKDNSDKVNTIVANNNISKSETLSNNNKPDKSNTSNNKVSTANNTKAGTKGSATTDISDGGSNVPINNNVVSAPTKKDTSTVLLPGDIPNLAPGDYSKNILSVYAGGNYSLGWSDNGAKEANGITPWGGFNFTHYFTGNLSASLGLGFSEINHLNNSYTSSLIQYDFGASSIVTTVTPQTVYYLAFPLNVQYNLDNKDVIGIGLDYLMMLTTVSTVNTYQQNYFATTSGGSISQNGYVQGFSNSVIQLTLSYRRMITDRLGISAEYYHDLGYIENNSIPGINQYTKNSGFRLVLSYQLMK